MLEEKEFQERIGRIESLVRKLEAIADPSARAVAKDLLQSILDLHGAGLERILEAASGTSLIDRLADDDVVCGLLVLHGLHPLDLETRVNRAIEKVRPRVRAQGGRLELLSVEEGVVRFRLKGADELKSLVEGSIYEMAPDIATIECEISDASLPSANFVPLAMLTASNSSLP